MTTDVNDTALAGWVIAFSNGLSLVGRPMEAGQTLAPVFQLEPEVVRGPGGKASIALRAAPILFLESLRSLVLPPSAILVPLEWLDRQDRQNIAAAVAQAEQQCQIIRAAKAGLVLR